MDMSSAVVIFLEGKKRVDKYGPNDGLPEIVGLNVLHFLQDRIRNNEMEQFAEIVRQMHFIPYNEMVPDQRTDRSSDILGLLWRRGAMELYDSEEYADTVDYIYQIDLDERILHVIRTGDYRYSFDELPELSDGDFLDRITE